MTLARILAVLVVAFSGLGCAFGEIRWDDPWGRLYSLEEQQKIYSDLVRWNDYTNAVRFVDPELAEQFMKREKMNLVFTDQSTPNLAIDAVQRNSTVKVKYTGYRPDTLYELHVEEQQVWHRTGGYNQWVVRPNFIGLEEEPPEKIWLEDLEDGEQPEGEQSAGEKTEGEQS